MPATHHRQIAIGVMIDDAMQEGWVLESLRQALAVPGVGLRAVAIMRRGKTHGVAGRLHQMVDALDRRLRCVRDGLFAPVNVPAALGAPEPFEIQAMQRGEHWLVDGGDVAKLRDAGADVWLCYCAQAPQSPFPRIAPMGVWGLEIGAQVPAASTWAGVAEVGEGSDVTEIQVVDYTRPGRDVVHRACGATVRNSARRNRLLALCKAVTFHARLLRGAMHDRSPGARTQVATPDLVPGRHRKPTVGAVLSLCRHLTGQVLSNRWRAAAMRAQWRIGYYYADEEEDATSPAHAMHMLVPPRDHDWADPFIVRHEGRCFIFFEDLPHRVGRAHISAVEVFAEGEVGKPQVVLQRPYHLSYPFVFEWDGAMYMIPETAGNGTVELYRCEQFPHRWSLCKVLLDGVRAFDSTLVCEGGLWWLFVNVAAPGAAPSEDLSLYWSHSPLGPWAAHAANPVVSDVRRARGAGPLFRRNGSLFRPSQDCGADYGSAVWINRIDLLDRNSYRETPVGRIDPDRKAGMRCLHTFGAEGRLRVVDFLVRQPRWSNA